jgi:hypothetical protein
MKCVTVYIFFTLPKNHLLINNSKVHQFELREEIAIDVTAGRLQLKGASRPQDRSLTSADDLRSFFRPLSQLMLLKCNWERWSYAFFMLEVVDYLQAVGELRGEAKHWAENEGFSLFHAALAEQRVDVLHVVQSGREGAVPRHTATAIGVMQRVRLLEHAVAEQVQQQHSVVPSSTSASVTHTDPNPNPVGQVKACITTVEYEVLVELYLRFGQSAGAARATTTLLQHAECQVLRYVFAHVHMYVLSSCTIQQIYRYV